MWHLAGVAREGTLCFCLTLTPSNVFFVRSLSLPLSVCAGSGSWGSGRHCARHDRPEGHLRGRGPSPSLQPLRVPPLDTVRVAHGFKF